MGQDCPSPSLINIQSASNCMNLKNLNSSINKSFPQNFFKTENLILSNSSIKRNKKSISAAIKKKVR